MALNHDWVLHPFCYLCFVFVCHTAMSVSCSVVVTCWERADLLALLYAIFSCGFVTAASGVLGQVWYLIASIPDLCLIPYFYNETCRLPHSSHALFHSFIMFDVHFKLIMKRYITNDSFEYID